MPLVQNKNVMMTDSGSNGKKKTSNPPTQEELYAQAAQAKSNTTAYQQALQNQLKEAQNARYQEEQKAAAKQQAINARGDQILYFMQNSTPANVAEAQNARYTAEQNAAFQQQNTTPANVAEAQNARYQAEQEAARAQQERNAQALLAQQQAQQQAELARQAEADRLAEAERLAEIERQNVGSGNLGGGNNGGGNGSGNLVINNGGGNPGTTFNNGSGISTSVTVPQDPVNASSVSPISTNGMDDLKNLYTSEYEQNMRDLEERRRQQEIELQNQYQRALADLENNYNANVSGMQNENDRALREAYINYKLGQKNVEQQLANAGITGGATESILANLFNAYGNNRNALNQNLQNKLADLSAVYNTNVANTEKNSSGDYSDLLNKYYDNMADVRRDYSSNLQDLALRDYNAQLESQLQAQKLNADLEKARISAASKGSTSTKTTSGKDLSSLSNASRQNIVNVIRGLTNDEADNYLSAYGLSDSAKNALKLDAGVSARTNTVANTSNTSNNSATATSASNSTQIASLVSQMQSEGKSNDNIIQMLTEAYSEGLVNYTDYSNLLRRVQSSTPANVLASQNARQAAINRAVSTQ